MNENKWWYSIVRKSVDGDHTKEVRTTVYTDELDNIEKAIDKFHRDHESVMYIPEGQLSGYKNGVEYVMTFGYKHGKTKMEELFDEVFG